MTEQTPEPTPQGQAPVPTPPPGSEPDKGKQPPWGDPENFNPDQAWQMIQRLKAERGDPQAMKSVKNSVDQSLKDQINEMKQSQAQQRDALAAALGVKPEETSDADKLASQIETLRGQIVASERRAIAVESKIPEEFQHMLTATDPEGLRKQAADLVRFAEAAHFAAATSQPTPPPAFQQNPGQGQGGAPLTPEAQEAAEYARFYPPRQTA